MRVRHHKRLTVREDARRQRRLRRGLAGLIARTAFVLGLLLVVPVGALVATSITIDGNFDDWAGVLADPANTMSDIAPDGTGGLNRDLTQGTATWDTTNLYLLFRRASTAGGSSWRYTAFIDCDDDGLLENTDRVVYYNFTGGGNFQSGGVARYAPAVAGGDLMVPDVKPAGGVGAAIAGAQYGAQNDPSIIVAEGRANWASLGVPTDSPIRIQFASGKTNGSIDDASGIVSLRRRALTLVAPQTVAGSSDTTVAITHTLTNTGNATETFALEAYSESGWVTEIRSGGVLVTSVTLARGQSAVLTLNVRVPATAVDGDKDSVQLTAVCQGDPAVSATLTDNIAVGRLLVIPDQTGSMAAGSVIRYYATVQNNSAVPRSVVTTVSSLQDWDCTLFEADGVTPLAPFNLAAWSSRPIVLDVAVPGTATVGLQDVATVRAAVSTDTALFGEGLFITTARLPLELTPDREQYAGPNTYSFFTQTVHNNWPVERQVSLAGVSSHGWQVTYFAEDGVTPTSTVLVGPNGGTRVVKMRVRIPAGVAAGTVDAITSTATAGVHTSSCDSTVTVTNLATYSGGGYTTTKSTFLLGETVYGRAMGLTPGTNAQLRFVDPNNATTTFTQQADALGAISGVYPLGPASAVGTWTLELWVGGTRTQSVPFYVVYNASITLLSATDAPSAGTTFTVTSKVRNRGPSPITATTLDYLVWWDSDSSGSFGAGDLYVNPLGVTQAFSGGTVPTTTATTGVTVAPNTTFTDNWAYPNSVLSRGGTWNVTLTWRQGSLVIDTRTTTFYSAMSALSVTLSSSSADLGDVNPDDTASLPVTVTVSAPGDYTLTTSYVDQANLGLTSALGPNLNGSPGLMSYSDTVGVLVPWSVEGAVSARVVYTVVLQ